MGADLNSAFLGEANLRRANFLGASLKKADFRGANLKRAENLSIQQISRVKTLYRAQIDPSLMEIIVKDYPHLLIEPEEHP